MTRAELTAALQAAGIEEARTEATALFCAYAGVTPAAAMAEPGLSCDDPRLAEALARRLAREPLAYILGECWFYGERYRVSPACLIPRPETELLVELACESLPRGGRFADFCTGSGCVAISTLVHRPDCTAVALDLSPAAIALARENARLNGVCDRITFLEADLRDAGGVWAEMARGPFDLILSNPPYVATADVAGLAPELHFEPKMAFDGGAEGMDFYTLFLEEYRTLLAPCGAFAFEIGADQGDLMRRLCARLGYACRIDRDLAGRDRIAVCRPLAPGVSKAV